MRLKIFVIVSLFSFSCASTVRKPETKKEEPEYIIVRPVVSQDVLANPGKGVMSFQRFDQSPLLEDLNWPEGFESATKIKKQNPRSYREYPRTRIAYFRIYWKDLEPRPRDFQWEIVDQILAGAKEQDQTVAIRLMPYGEKGHELEQAPKWFLDRSGKPPNKLPSDKWAIDQNNPNYPKYFSRLIESFAKRYDGNPQIEYVDISVSGPWGEGAATSKIKKSMLRKLFEAYLRGFKKTFLVVQPWDWKAARDVEKKLDLNVGVRFDCLGDLGGFSKTWSHMYDLYPQEIIRSGLQGAWKVRPVTLEACWVMQKWADEDWDIDYIIEQSLKWRISSINLKSSAVPSKWRNKVNRWVSKMGYRFALRRFEYKRKLKPGDSFLYKSWWENLGVAPIYKKYPLVLRFSSGSKEIFRTISTDSTQWMPGDFLVDGSFQLDSEFILGDYQVDLALVSAEENIPAIQLAIEGTRNDGWFPLGKFAVAEKK